MSDVVIFVYGLVVFTIVSAACWMIVWGIVAERRDRERLETERSAEGAGSSESAPTLNSGAPIGVRKNVEGTP